LSLADTGVHVFVSPDTGVQLSPRITPLAVTVVKQVIDALTLFTNVPIASTVAVALMLAEPSAIIPPFAVNVAFAVIDALPNWTIVPTAETLALAVMLALAY
jgi:hypothetical protein